MRETTESIMRGGTWRVPPELRGTLLGKQLEQELKARASASKAARLQAKAEKKAQERQAKMVMPLCPPSRSYRTANRPRRHLRTGARNPRHAEGVGR